MTRQRATWAAGGTLLAAAAVALGWLAWPRGQAEAADTSAGRTATARVERRDVVHRESFDGTLGYSDSRPLLAAQPSGILTRLAPEGSTRRRGDTLYEVDGKPVFLLYGAKPAWRSLAAGVERGWDVRQLEQNLIALGYDPDDEITLDESFDSATEQAIKRWEKDRNATEDGSVQLGEIVFLPGARRIGAHTAQLGSRLQPGSELIQTSSTRRLVTLQLDAGRQELVAAGDSVRVELPDGRSVKGTISRVSPVAESGPGDQEEEAEPTIEVQIAVGNRVPGRLDAAPVDVAIAREAKQNVLAAPVSALLALAGGGYALEVESSGRRTLVRIQIGLFADGYVEVEGRGIRAGTKVVVPR